MTSSTETQQTSQVVEFYRNKNVLITGASGFLGKVLLWKLVDSCTEIGTIFILLRSKNNVSAEKRALQILKTKPFVDRFKLDFLLEKIVPIDSDLTAPGLGLSDNDRKLLENKVNVVIHSAASVKFDAPLKDNLRDNVYGTKSILELCDSIKSLNALVHVSTAYSNCHLFDIDESLKPLANNIDQVVRSVEDATCGPTNERLLEGRPNTYTYTKALAEHFVARHEGKYPIAIVRPSIVISSNKEPCEGWVDNVNGIAGLGCLAAIGLLRTIDWNYYATSDMVPVDLVTNCLICSAFEVSTRSQTKLLVYNMTSGNVNPISWGRFFDMSRESAVKRPPNKIVRPIIEAPRYEKANPITFTLTRFLSELLFAYLVDLILVLIGYKRALVKITKRMHHGYRILKPFTRGNWNFRSVNVQALADSLNSQDRKLFNFDMRNFDWAHQADLVWSGARTFLLKEEPTEESYSRARSRQKLVTIIHYCFMLVIWVIISLTILTSVRFFRSSDKLIV